MVEETRCDVCGKIIYSSIEEDAVIDENMIRIKLLPKTEDMSKTKEYALCYECGKEILVFVEKAKGGKKK